MMQLSMELGDCEISCLYASALNKLFKFEKRKIAWKCSITRYWRYLQQTVQVNWTVK